MIYLIIHNIRPSEIPIYGHMASLSVRNVRIVYFHYENTCRLGTHNNKGRIKTTIFCHPLYTVYDKIKVSTNPIMWVKYWKLTYFLLFFLLTTRFHVVMCRVNAVLWFIMYIFLNAPLWPCVGIRNRPYCVILYQSIYYMSNIICFPSFFSHISNIYTLNTFPGTIV